MQKVAITFTIFILITLLGIRWIFSIKRIYNIALAKELESLLIEDKELITEKDLEKLPDLIKEYLIKSETIGKPKVKYFKAEFEGRMRMGKNNDFYPVKATQYNFIKSGTRIFFMEMNYKGIDIKGLHYYHAKDALMKIKILDLIKVVDKSGAKMQKAETVTYFNDLCIMAPGALIDEDITWEVLSEESIRGTLRKHENTVSAILKFNAEGMLENFISDDRFISNGDEFENISWSTPMSSHSYVNDYFLPNKGQAIWHYPDKELSYIEIDIKDVRINEK